MHCFKSTSPQLDRGLLISSRSFPPLLSEPSDGKRDRRQKKRFLIRIRSIDHFILDERRDLDGYSRARRHAPKVLA